MDPFEVCMLGCDLMNTTLSAFRNSLNPRNINIGDESGLTLLHWAIISCNLEEAEVLLQRGADVNLTDHYGWTPFHFAVFHDRYEAMQLLLQYDSDVNKKTRISGWTPLSMAAPADVKTHKLLIQHGAILFQGDFNIHTDPYLTRIAKHIIMVKSDKLPCDLLRMLTLFV